MLLTGIERGDTLYTQCDNKEESMVKRLTTHGNSSALIIERPILELLNIGPETLLEIATDGKNLIVSPIHEATREKKIKAALAKVNQQHGKTLRKLAE